MSKISIPKNVREGFIYTSRASEETQGYILESIKSLDLGDSSEDLTSSLTEKASLNSDDAREVTFMIYSLMGLAEQSKQASDEVASELLEAFDEFNDNKEFNAAAFFNFLKAILDVVQASSINLTRKAYQLIFDRQNIFSDSKTIVDVRPVFLNEDATELKALTLLYNLRISFRESIQSEEYSNIVFALDSDDIQQLKEGIARAETKANTLKKELSNFVFIQPK
ncbi:hypothetical protein [Lewinella sp. JB7]|uniref:hypothetical protein n=1 Tax=Lewinella sp. JB7 TaxID=2962887 RepID=UPI0020CA05F4|nr:hypothetical protein [Lewinella sp. JB7]MCP9237944.1 hypothetical protein [Lewinella sp. JB7]